MPELVLLMLESAWPLLQSTYPAGSSSLATTHHWQPESGQQCSCWLEAAWPFASLNLPGQYLPLDTGSPSRGNAATGPQLPSSLQSKLNLNLLRKFKFKFNGKLIPIIPSFKVLSQISKSTLKKSRGYKFKTLQRHVHWQQARAMHMISDWLQAWLAVVVQTLLYSQPRL